MTGRSRYFEDVKKPNRKEYLEKVARVTGNPPKKWCKIHPTAFWGETYDKCIVGYKKGENCERGE